MSNPFLHLDYEPAFEALGGEYSDIVTAAEFPMHQLRFRNDCVLTQLGLNPETVTDDHFIEAFGKFEAVRPLLAMRYHGYQFREYNPYLGDGRGFLYGQTRGIDGELYDFGTKGSGRTPYSRSADGRLTLKGGVREVLAAEMLHRMRVKTSRCLSLIETGEQLWRGDEPSPTRSSVMIRFSSSHIRFGTFERLHYLKRKDLIEILLDHVITYYYSSIKLESDRYILFYAELVKRVAELVAQWMASGFCHGVLNTDNMSITGESFDYGPYAFMPDYNLQFTAAYFDYGKLYCYGNQPFICEGNLELLQKPLSLVIPLEELKKALDPFQQYYRQFYRQRMINRLGFEQLPTPEAEELLQITINLLKNNRVSYPDFFMQLREQFCQQWQDQPQNILKDAEPMEHLDAWRQQYYHHLQTLSYPELEQIKQRLNYYNPQVMIIRPEIEAVWEQITLEDNWQPFNDLLAQIQTE